MGEENFVLSADKDIERRRSYLAAAAQSTLEARNASSAALMNGEPARICFTVAARHRTGRNFVRRAVGIVNCRQW